MSGAQESPRGAGGLAVVRGLNWRGLGAGRVLASALWLAALLVAAFGVWALAESNAYLDEVRASGQEVGAHDGLSFLIQNAIVYVLWGLVLAALGYVVWRLGGSGSGSGATAAALPASALTAGIAGPAVASAAGSTAPGGDVAGPAARTEASARAAAEDELDEFFADVDVDALEATDASVERGPAR